MNSAALSHALELDPLTSSGELNIIIEAPDGSRNQYKHDLIATEQSYRLHPQLPPFKYSAV
jgi:hypothetical protein